MHKTFFAVLAGACLLLAVALWAFGPAVPLPKPIGWGSILLLGLWASWPLLRHINRRFWAFLGIGVIAVAMTGCGTLGAGQSNLAPVITALAAAGCTGDLNFNIQAGSAAGISPGSFSVGNTFHGACDPRNATVVPPPAPPK